MSDDNPILNNNNIRMTSFNSTGWWTFYGVMFFISFGLLGLMFHRRLIEPIKSRSWGLVIISIVYGVFFCGVLVHRIITVRVEGDFTNPCPLFIWSLVGWLALWAAPIFLRTYVLHFRFRWQEEMIMVDSHSPDSTVATTATAVDTTTTTTDTTMDTVEKDYKKKFWFHRHQKLISPLCLGVVFIVILIVHILMGVIFLYAAPDISTAQKEKTCTYRVTYLLYILPAIYIVGVIILVLKTWKVDDTYSVKKELKILCVTCIILFLLFVSANANDSNFPFHFVLYNGIGIVIMNVCLSLIYPLWLSYEEEKRRNNKKPDAFKLLRVTEDLELTPEVYVTVSMNTRLIVNRCVNGGLDGLLACLEHEALHASLKSFMVQSWCVEYLLFFQDLYSFKKTFGLSMPRVVSIDLKKSKRLRRKDQSLSVSTVSSKANSQNSINSSLDTTRQTEDPWLLNDYKRHGNIHKQHALVNSAHVLNDSDKRTRHSVTKKSVNRNRSVSCGGVMGSGMHLSSLTVGYDINDDTDLSITIANPLIRCLRKGPAAYHPLTAKKNNRPPLIMMNDEAALLLSPDNDNVQKESVALSNLNTKGSIGYGGDAYPSNSSPSSTVATSIARMLRIRDPNSSNRNKTNGPSGSTLRSSRIIGRHIRLSATSSDLPASSIWNVNDEVIDGNQQEDYNKENNESNVAASSVRTSVEVDESALEDKDNVLMDLVKEMDENLAIHSEQLSPSQCKVTVRENCNVENDVTIDLTAFPSCNAHIIEPKDPQDQMILYTTMVTKGCDKVVDSMSLCSSNYSGNISPTLTISNQGLQSNGGSNASLVSSVTAKLKSPNVNSKRSGFANMLKHISKDSKTSFFSQDTLEVPDFDSTRAPRIDDDIEYLLESIESIAVCNKLQLELAKQIRDKYCVEASPLFLKRIAIDIRRGIVFAFDNHKVGPSTFDLALRYVYEIILVDVYPRWQESDSFHDTIISITQADV